MRFFKSIFKLIGVVAAGLLVKTLLPETYKLGQRMVSTLGEGLKERIGLSLQSEVYSTVVIVVVLAIVWLISYKLSK